MRLSPAVWGLMSTGSSATGSFLLPVGTVTFLLADVEGSTRQWETDDTAMAEAMGRLDDLATAAIARHGGVRPIEQGEGDSFVAAFSRASEAVSCALDIQRELETESLPRVRMGLHTGEAELRDETRYFGRAITRAARLRDLGHGGQVLLSRACVDLVADHLPAEAGLEDLGPHRMRDLTRAEHVFQLVHRDLPGGFPPLRSLDRRPHNLPVQLTSFVGRDGAIAEVGQLIADHRLVTLTGSGGCGKTRLGLQVAAEALVGREDGAWFVDLSGLSDPGLVPASVMAVLRIREVPGQTHTATLVSELADEDALIVLDNCEHVLSAAAELAATLLSACGRLAVLATSREPLGVAGETVWRVPSLSVPDERGATLVESLDASEAVRLFIERARAARPNFAVTNETAPTVAAICQHLDGIPLAIELAAARVRMMSVERIAEALSDRFRLLTGGARTALPRQQTLRASVDWSHDLLPTPERALLRRLSVFAGGFSLDAAEAVGSGGDVEVFDVLGLLASLVDKSLVQADDSGERYRLLETIRAYAAEELVASCEEPATRDRHLAYFAEFSGRAEAAMWTPQVVAWLPMLDSEHDNLRAALDWSEASQQYDTGAAIVNGVAQFWYIRALRSEGLSRCETFLANGLPAQRRGELYYWAACFAAYSDPAATMRYGQALAQLGRDTSDDVATARGLGQIGCIQWVFEPADALSTLQEAHSLARSAGDGITVVDALCFTASAHLVLGHCLDAVDSAEKALAAALEIDWPWGIGFATSELAHATVMHGDLDRTQACAGTLAQLGSELEDPWLTQCGHLMRGTVAMYRADPTAAEALAEARRLAERQHDYLNLPTIYGYEGLLALGRGDEHQGARILEAANPVADAFLPARGVVNRTLLAESAIRRSDLTEARRWIDEAMARPGSGRSVWVLRARARLARSQGDPQRAWEIAVEGLEAALVGRVQLLVIDLLELLASIAAETDRHLDAARLLDLAERERTRLGYAPFAYDRLEADATRRAIDAALGAEGGSMVMPLGTELSVEETVEYLRRGRGQRARASSGWGSLTPTERKVVELVVEGLSNAEIGARMFVSTATVKSHLTHVFVKLGVRDRRTLAAAARELTV